MTISIIICFLKGVTTFPISKISKINFASWIRGFCRHLSHPFFLLEDQDPKIVISKIHFFESP